MTYSIRRIPSLVWRKGRESVRTFAGWLFCKLPFIDNWKFLLIRTIHTPKKRSAFSDYFSGFVIEAWERFEYYRERDPALRERLKRIAMEGEGGVEWAKRYLAQSIDLNARLGNMSVREACPHYELIDQICSNSSGNLLVIQIGSSSGREIAYFASRHPAVSFIGTDIDDDIVDFQRQTHHFQNVVFASASANDLSSLMKEQAQRPLLLFSNGSMQYVQPEYLPDFFARLVKFDDIQLVFVENGDEKDGTPEGFCMSKPRAGFSFTHDYRFYAEMQGFETMESRIIRPYVPYNKYGHHFTVHYFYHGRVKRSIEA